tara:strand:+ start:14491 stop:15720 length:1230 start_codon:yes stop_codon:yes gene_type:complete
MSVVEILEEIKKESSSKVKQQILKAHSQNTLLQQVLKYGLDSFTPFNIVKVPKIDNRKVSGNEAYRWMIFFDIADACSTRHVTGNEATRAMVSIFACVSEEEEKWMRKILKKNLGIGASIKTVNKVFSGLIPTFEVSLAQKFDKKRLIGRDKIAVEPKLDGIRCFAIVENGEAKLFARSGKLISNFDSTIGAALSKMKSGCYDGELMGQSFTDIMRQAYRKEDLDTSGTYLALFDYLPLAEWKSGDAVLSCDKRREVLLDNLSDENIDLELVQPVERLIIEASYEEIKKIHDDYVSEGFEGVMIKYLEEPYRFGRGYEVMKMKEFHDVDLPIKSLEEGTGKHAGKLGSVTVEFKGVDVRVGSGFSDDLREKIWQDRESFIGRLVEVRYQEITSDGSLRFPTFVCFRNDK